MGLEIAMRLNRPRAWRSRKPLERFARRKRGNAMQLISPKDKFAFTAYHAPAKGTRKGGVVVIQEIFGITNHIRAMADRFAAEGYEAIAPSLYDRIEPGFEIKGVPTPESLQKGIAAVQKTPWDQVAADVQAAIDALQPDAKFITGFCYGGAVCWLAAARCKGLTAASGFYGGAITMLLEDKPKAPIILHYGKNDGHIPPEAIDKVRAAAPSVPIYMYDAGHGFCREGSADYDKVSCNLAMARTLDFFDQHAKQAA
jgi:carboxymethylenebutenolidase